MKRTLCLPRGSAMPKFHSLRINDEPREPLPAFRTTENAQDILNQKIEPKYTTVTPAVSDEQYFRVEPISDRYTVQPTQSNSPTARVQTLHSRYRASQGNTEK